MNLTKNNVKSCRHDLRNSYITHNLYDSVLVKMLKDIKYKLYASHWIAGLW